MAKTKFTLLLPLNYNDGSEVPETLLHGMCNELFDLAGGYGLPGTVTGAYRMKDGTKQVDRSMIIWVAVEESDEAELRQLVAKFAAELRQEVLYLERTGGTVEFIPPAPNEETP